VQLKTKELQQEMEDMQRELGEAWQKIDDSKAVHSETRDELKTTRAELVTALTQTLDSQFRIEKDINVVRRSANVPEVYDVDEINNAMVSPPPATDSRGEKRSNLAIMAENNNRVKRVKKEKEDIERERDQS